MPTLAENLARTESDGFGLAHLPYASFSAPGSTKAQLGIRLGDNVYAVATVLEHAVNVSPEVKAVAESPNLDALLTAGHMVWSELRECLRTILTELGRSDDLLESSYPVGDVHLHMPFTVGDYVDFYGNEHHATNVGRIFRPTQPPLTPNSEASAHRLPWPFWIDNSIQYPSPAAQGNAARNRRRPIVRGFT